MSQADAFFDAIRESPDDDAPRLIFADWLDDHGDGDRAAFIRAQVRLAPLAADDPDRFDREDEADDLLRRHPEWAGRLSELARSWEFRRGFVESATLGGGTFLSYASSLVADFPLRDLCFFSAAPQVAFLARSPHLAHVESLAFRAQSAATSEQFSDTALRDLFASPHLGRLTALDVSGCGVEWPAVRELIASPLLARLRWLDLSGNRGIADRAVRQLSQAPAARSLEALSLAGTAITPSGLLDLFTAPCMTALTRLDLTVCPSAGWSNAATAVKAAGGPLPPRLTDLRLNETFPAAAALALARSPHVGRLTALRLAGAGAGDALAAALAESPHAPALRSLDLSRNGIGPAGARALAESAALAGLTELRLVDNKLRDAGARAVAASPHLKALTTLDLARNAVGGPGLQALVGSPNLAGLTTLILSGNYVGPASVEALARSPYLGRLTWLELGQVNLDEGSARALAASPNLARLRTLHLYGNRLGDAGVKALAASPHLGRLRALNLDGNDVGKAGAEALAASPHLRRLRTLQLRGGNLTDTERDLLRARFGDGVTF